MANKNDPSLLTTPQHVRLECVKLAFRHDRSAEDTIAKATEFEKYITGDVTKNRQGEPDAPI